MHHHWVTQLLKPSKCRLQNEKLTYSLSSLSAQIGTVRETFAVNQLLKTNTVTYPKSGDILVNERYLFEVGGKNKTKKQIAGIKNQFILKTGPANIRG